MANMVLLLFLLAGVPGIVSGRYYIALHRLQHKVASLERTVQTLKQNSEEVGFHVTLSKQLIVKIGDTITFDRIITNLGRGYNTTSGEFFCRNSGTYLFNLNILASRNSDIEADIIKANNDETVLKTISYNKIDGSYRQGSGSAILILSEGDVILVRMVAKLGNQIVLPEYSYFSGYRLH